MASAWATASRGRRWIVSLSNLYLGSAESTLAQTADDLLLFASGRLVRQGRSIASKAAPSDTPSPYAAKVDELRAALRARGVDLAGGPERFFVELPREMKAHDLLALSLDVGAPIVELVPRIPVEP